MPTTPNMSLALPTEGGDADIWDTLLNAVFTLVDSHDHTTGKGVKVPSAALKINADVSWAFGGSSFAITDAKALDFAAVTTASVSALAGALFVNSADNELYFRSVAGTNIKITSGTTLNVSIVGGIGGDYASVGALLDYDDATDTYRFRQETAAAVRQFAKVSMADLIIREYDPAGDASVPVETVTIKSPDTLAASYALTLPAALPGVASLLQTTTGGVISASNTLAQSVSVADLRYTSSQFLTLPATAAVEVTAGTHTKQLGASNAQNRWLVAASVSPLTWPIPVRSGDRITGYGIYVDKNTSNLNTIAARLYKTTGGDGAETALGAGSSSSADAPDFIQLAESGLSLDVSTNEQYYLVFTPGGGIAPAADNLYHAAITITRP